MRNESDGREKTAVTAGETIKSLNEQLGDPSLKSSTRILILILMATNKKMSSVELRAVTGLGKGSLENHLDKLAEAGHVRIRKTRSFSGSGRRQMVEITEKGLEECKALLSKIRTFDV